MAVLQEGKISLLVVAESGLLESVLHGDGARNGRLLNVPEAILGFVLAVSNFF